ncbi:hypothetical protein JX580_02335 [Thiomicrospira microaerophila]|uniref:hypothetical protein n=1 Tax=Thiomicrospira microaerophila TaxID=406020 RepID=UPI00200F23D8|nr:hypothetical protein [Thiomicrospira microaerophila]UQB42756.1 hypothetical protein JX580_02335 [Thiomicrospira microaerophila]
MYLSKIINIQTNTNTNDLFNRGRFSKLEASEQKIVQNIAFFSLEEVKQRLASLQSISKAVTVALNHEDDGVYDAVQDGLNIAYFLTCETQTLETLLELHEEAQGIKTTQARLCQT